MCLNLAFAPTKSGMATEVRVDLVSEMSECPGGFSLEIECLDELDQVQPPTPLIRSFSPCPVIWDIASYLFSVIRRHTCQALKVNKC